MLCILTLLVVSAVNHLSNLKDREFSLTFALRRMPRIAVLTLRSLCLARFSTSGTFGGLGRWAPPAMRTL